MSKSIKALLGIMWLLKVISERIEELVESPLFELCDEYRSALRNAQNEVEDALADLTEIYENE